MKRIKRRKLKAIPGLSHMQSSQQFGQVDNGTEAVAGPQGLPESYEKAARLDGLLNAQRHHRRHSGVSEPSRHAHTPKYIGPGVNCPSRPSHNTVAKLEDSVLPQPQKPKIMAGDTERFGGANNGLTGYGLGERLIFSWRCGHPENATPWSHAGMRGS